jgi:hypothetical protein
MQCRILLKCVPHKRLGLLYDARRSFQEFYYHLQSHDIEGQESSDLPPFLELLSCQLSGSATQATASLPKITIWDEVIEGILYHNHPYIEYSNYNYVYVFRYIYIYIYLYIYCFLLWNPESFFAGIAPFFCRLSTYNSMRFFRRFASELRNWLTDPADPCYVGDAIVTLCPRGIVPEVTQYLAVKSRNHDVHKRGNIS